MSHCSPWIRCLFLVLMGWGLAGACTGTRAQQDVDAEHIRRYQGIVMEVLSNRLAAEVGLEDGRVVLRTPASRTLKDLTAVVQASAPYYLEGAMEEFKRFRPRVKEALAALDGWRVPPAPRGWDSGEWTYFQVQGALEEVMLLVALDVGVYTNALLAGQVGARDELGTDWERLRGGRDAIDPMPLPDFGNTTEDGSTLDGLGGAGNEDGDVDGLAEGLRALTRRIEALERGGGGRTDSEAGSLPGRGPDGGWLPGTPSGRRVPPERLPEQFTLQFPSGSAALGLSAEYGLNTLVEWMVALPGLRVLVTGHSDASGSERANMELSRRRAQVVRYYLLERGIAADRVTAAHFGEQRPEWGAGFDRRVEVRLLLD